MRGKICLCLTLAVISGGWHGASAQKAKNKTKPTAGPQQAPTADSAADAAKDDDQEEKELPMGVNTIRVLPDDVPPNPPKPEDLKLQKMVWHGEYEADHLGKPLLGPDGKPLPVLYNLKGKRQKSKIKIPKTHPITIVAGTLTVDGWTGKARLNYDIPDLKYIYLSAPTVGTVIISQTAFPGSVEQKGAFDGSNLTVKAGDHELQLASDKPMLGKKPVAAWVKIDPAYTEDPKYPVMGYGSKAKSPYEWPGAKLEKAKEKSSAVVEAPPLPVSMRPKMVTPVCIAQPGGKPCPKPAPAAVTNQK